MKRLEAKNSGDAEPPLDFNTVTEKATLTLPFLEGEKRIVVHQGGSNQGAKKSENPSSASTEPSSIHHVKAFPGEQEYLTKQIDLLEDGEVKNSFEFNFSGWWNP